MNRQDRGWRDRKRAMLRVMLLAAAPMMIASANADSPVPSNQLLLPPLPLTRATSSGPQINPFCQPAAVAGQATVKVNENSSPVVIGSGATRRNLYEVPATAPTLRLASGNEEQEKTSQTAGGTGQRMSVRLLPLDIEPQSDPMAAVPASNVRSNPMVIVEPIDREMRPGTLHAVGTALPVDVQVAVPVVTPVLPSVKAPVDAPVVGPVVGPTETQPPVHLAERKAKKSQLPKVASDSVPKPPTIPAPVILDAKQEGPVSFSLDDETLVDTSLKSIEIPAPVGSFASLMRQTKPAEPAKLQIPTQPATTESGSQPATPQVVSQPAKQQTDSEDQAPHADSQPATPKVVSLPEKGTFRLGKAAADTRELDPTASIARGKTSSRVLLVPLPPTDDPSTMSEREGRDARIVRGVRPRVEVGVLPVAIERVTQPPAVDAAAAAQLASAVATKPSPVPTPQETVFDTATPIIVSLKRTEVRPFKVDGEIRKVQLGNSSVCTAIAAGTSQLQLIGTQDGVTRMAIWTASAAGEDKKDIYEIHVGASSQSNAPDVAEMANVLTKSARAAFPDSDIRVRFDKGQMIVEGNCASNESAKQTLRMIRSACLLPVVDKLTIR